MIPCAFLQPFQADETRETGIDFSMIDVVIVNASHVNLTTVSTVAGFLPLYLAG